MEKRKYQNTLLLSGIMFIGLAGMIVIREFFLTSSSIDQDNIVKIISFSCIGVGFIINKLVVSIIGGCFGLLFEMIALFQRLPNVSDSLSSKVVVGNICSVAAIIFFVLMIMFVLKKKQLLGKIWWIVGTIGLIAFVILYYCQLVALESLAAYLNTSLTSYFNFSDVCDAALPIVYFVSCYQMKKYKFPIKNITEIGGADKLKNMKELFDSGVLTAEEYETKKQEILQLYNNSMVEKNTSETMSKGTVDVQNITDELMRYKELLDNGAISQEDFDAMKKKMMGL